jgi:general secretion pathway protein C
MLGLSLAWFVTSEAEIRLNTGSISLVANSANSAQSRNNQQPANNRIILQRNIFNSAQPAQVARPTATQTAVTSPQALSRLTLIGTVVAGEESLAVINTGKQIEVIRLNDIFANDSTLVSVGRDHIEIETAQGARNILHLDTNGSTPSQTSTSKRAKSSTNRSAIVNLGTNRWRIPTTEAKRIRTNISSIIKQVRIDPHIVAGTTDGFVIKRIQRNTLLSQMGLKRGDILHAVNGVTLDSPEKGLQIFQQLREAKSLSLDLKRAGQSLNFQYEIK